MDLTTGDLLALFAVIITPKEVFSILYLSIASSIDNNCFSILDHASTTFQLKIKEAIHIQLEKPTLNHQLYHVNLKLSL